MSSMILRKKESFDLERVAVLKKLKVDDPVDL